MHPYAFFTFAALALAPGLTAAADTDVDSFPLPPLPRGPEPWERPATMPVEVPITSGPSRKTQRRREKLARLAAEKRKG